MRESRTHVRTEPGRAVERVPVVEDDGPRLDEVNAVLDDAAEPLGFYRGVPAVIYTRSVDPATGLTASEQARRLRRLAEDRGLSVVGVLQDGGPTRPVLRGLVGFVHTCGIDDGVVLVDRRSQILPRDCGYALGEIEGAGWRQVVVDLDEEGTT